LGRDGECVREADEDYEESDENRGYRVEEEAETSQVERSLRQMLAASDHQNGLRDSFVGEYQQRLHETRFGNDESLQYVMKSMMIVEPTMDWKATVDPT
jgi:hypothetical protein